MHRELPPEALVPGRAESLCTDVLSALNVPAFMHRGGQLLYGNAALQRLICPTPPLRWKMMPTNWP